MKRQKRPCDWCKGPMSRMMWIDYTGAWQKFVPMEKQKDSICRRCFLRVPGVRRYLKSRPELTGEQVEEILRKAGVI